ncbi:fibronectin type III domain-containing protein [Conexibacter woesei]|uniref:fibronectin type III domain-containing protein n=1 Tax=Conexibacter woesei TaxID=191495 RepID=UPI000410B10D|nr:fibronectin type III domain-containing protein [Conexibacter woesei]
MSRKTPVAFAAALATLAVAVPAASAAVTTTPLTISQSGDVVTFTVAPGGDWGSADGNALLIAPAGSGTTTVAASMGHGGFGAAKVTGSTADCQTLTSSDATMLTDVPDPTFSDDGSGFTWKIPAADLPASFDAKVVFASDFSADGCSPDADHNGIVTTMADAQRFPVPPVVVAPAPVVTPAPAPAPAPVATPVAAPKPVADPDKDGIKNNWLVDGKPVAAPKAAKVAGVTAHGATLTLPKAPKGATIRVYVRVAGTGTFKAVTVKINKKTGKATLSGLKAGKHYEVKLVAVNKAGQQTTASKAAVVKTTKK